MPILGEPFLIQKCGKPYIYITPLRPLSRLNNKTFKWREEWILTDVSIFWFERTNAVQLDSDMHRLMLSFYARYRRE